MKTRMRLLGHNQDPTSPAAPAMPGAPLFLAAAFGQDRQIQGNRPGARLFSLFV